MSIISPKDEETLVIQGPLTPTTQDGMRKIHKRRLNRFSDEEYSHLPLSPVLITSSSAESEVYMPIPENLVSLATVKFLGYDEETAMKIWRKWRMSAPGDPVPEYNAFDMPFIELVTGYLLKGQRLDTSEENDQEWYDCLSFCGVNKDTQTAIMDPVFRSTRLTESCLFWARDTMELRYRSLKAIRKASKEREVVI